MTSKCLSWVTAQPHRGKFCLKNSTHKITLLFAFNGVKIVPVSANFDDSAIVERRLFFNFDFRDRANVNVHKMLGGDRNFLDHLPLSVILWKNISIKEDFCLTIFLVRITLFNIIKNRISELFRFSYCPNRLSFCSLLLNQIISTLS